MFAVGLAACSQTVFGSGPWIDVAPPTLDVYLERLPAKSLGQIFLETSSAPLPDTSLPLGFRMEQIIDRIGKEPVEKLIAEVDSLLADARTSISTPQEVNDLHDLRDALVSAPQHAAEYMKWRRSHLPLNAHQRDGDSSEKVLAEKPQFAAEIEKRAAAAKGPIRAHWYYLRGALAFNCDDKTEARTWFDRVVNEFPTHPRAEIALFMSARCSLSISRIDPWGGTPEERAKKEAAAPAEREKARVGFQAVLDRYPKGRFAGDALGWLGAVTWDAKENLAALDYYIRQAELRDHPELLKSSVLMTEKVLRRVAASPDGDAAFALIAKHPRVAMGMLYLVLGSPDAAGTIPNDDEDRTPNVSQKLREWRKAILPRLASAVAAQEGKYAPEPWMPRYLALLAHVASEEGKQEEAIRLAEGVPEAAQNDDLLFAKAIAQQRAGKPKEAVETFRLLLKRFPTSPLLPGARIRLAVALRDNHQSGLALVQLRRLIDDAQKPKNNASGEDDLFEKYNSVYPPADSKLKLTDSAIYPDVSNAELDQVKQLIDTLLNFAPLEELAVAVDSPEIDPAVALDWRAAIAQRALAHEDFATARSFMSPAQFGLVAANLEALTSKVAEAKDPTQKAELQMRLGDAWAAARGKLLRYPLDAMSTKESVFHEEPNLAEVNRRKNGMVLGFHNLDAQMEAREELRHANRWWLDAARTLPASPLSAAARLKVLDTMAQIAIASDYSFLRANETDMEQNSRQIYDRLQAECPKSDEAKKAAYLSLSGTAPNPASRSADYDDWDGFRNRRAGFLWSDFGAFGDFHVEDFGSYDGGVGDLRESSLDVASLAKQVSAACKIARRDKVSTPVINALEDLTLFLREPGITPEMAHAYINLRIDVLACSFGVPFEIKVEGVPPDSNADAEVRSRIARALKDPKMKPVRDYLEFLDAAVVANHRISVETEEKDKGEPFTYNSRDYPALERMMRAFLKCYPNSKKREAARLLLARAVFRQSWPWIERLGIPSTTGGFGIYPQEFTTKYYQREPFDPKRVVAELDAYDKEFPNGRYAADIRSMRASTLWRMGDWKPALDITLDQLDHATPDLQRDASFRLANIFAKLANHEHRPAVLAALRGNRRAIDQLN
jgi:outer membrane protein assembly factor BamD (BamD/ComL family)